MENIFENCNMLMYLLLCRLQEEVDNLKSGRPQSPVGLMSGPAGGRRQSSMLAGGSHAGGHGTTHRPSSLMPASLSGSMPDSNGVAGDIWRVVPSFYTSFGHSLHDQDPSPLAAGGRCAGGGGGGRGHRTAAV